MINKWQKYVAIASMILIGVLILSKLVYNYKAKQLVWENDDATSLANACLDDLGGLSVRFPLQSEVYCECSTQALMDELSKADYLEIHSRDAAEQEKRLLPIILDCHNTYQEAIYNASKLD